jgi:O-antigen ligase
MNREAVREWGPVLLVWSCLVVLPFGRGVELPVLIMTILGIRLIVQKGREAYWEGPSRIFTIAFLCVWIPAVLSMPDAYVFERTLSVVLTYLRLYLSGLFIVHALSTPLAQRRFLRLSAWVVLFWVADGLFQAVFGFDVFGFPDQADRLNGIFNRHVKLGLALAMVSPWLLEYGRRSWPLAVQALMWLALVGVMLLAGSRAGWIMFGVVVLAYLALSWSRTRRLPWRLMTAGVVMVAAVGVAAYHMSPRFEGRVDRSLEVLKGTRKAVDASMSGRVDIWTTALKMVEHHPINGVGARNFRYAYPDYAAKNDQFVQEAGPNNDHYVDADTETGPTHSHQLLLEMSSETGLIGLAGILFMMWWLARQWFRVAADRKDIVVPAAFSVLAMLFPLNSHWAIFSSFFSQLLFWAIAVYCAALGAAQRAPEQAGP